MLSSVVIACTTSQCSTIFPISVKLSTTSTFRLDFAEPTNIGSARAIDGDNAKGAGKPNENRSDFAPQTRVYPDSFVVIFIAFIKSDRSGDRFGSVLTSKQACLLCWRSERLDDARAIEILTVEDNLPALSA
jgi:hypothetical protein